MSDCMINPLSSRVCILGTKSCVMKHTGIVERDKRIAELEVALQKQDSVAEDAWSENEKLEAENEQLRKKVEVQGFNLRLREIDGSMDVDALIKDAEMFQWIENNATYDALGFWSIALSAGPKESFREALYHCKQDAARVSDE